jgi:hypothetical protein
MGELREREVSAVVACARCGGSGLFDADESDAAGEGQREKGEGQQLAHVGDSVRGRFQQPPVVQATAGVECSMLTKATLPAKASAIRVRAISLCMEGDSDGERFQQPLPWHATAGVGFSRL